MFINKEGKLFGKVSIVDIAVIVLILAAAFGIYVRFAFSNDKIATSSQCIEYKMEIRGIRQGTVDALKKKGEIFNDATQECIGEIVGVETKEAFEERTLTNGEIRFLPLPEKYDATITVRIDGSVNDSGYYTGENQMMVAGSKYTVTTKYARTTGEIVSIGEVE